MPLHEVLTNSGYTALIIEASAVTLNDLEELSRGTINFLGAVAQVGDERFVYFGRGVTDEFVNAIKKDNPAVTNIHTANVSTWGKNSRVWNVVVPMNDSLGENREKELAIRIIQSLDKSLVDDKVVIQTDGGTGPTFIYDNEAQQITSEVGPILSYGA